MDFKQWKNMICVSDQDCKTWNTGEFCCEDGQCCDEETVPMPTDVFTDIDYSLKEVVESTDYFEDSEDENYTSEEWSESSEISVEQEEEEETVDALIEEDVSNESSEE